MPSGRVLRFDAVRGYGFIKPTDGGEDVFLHANDLLVPEAAIRPGVLVEFALEEGDRGYKASRVKMSVAPAAQAEAVAEDEPLCDILTSSELTAELTEILLITEPPLTGAQIIDARRRLLDFAKMHGWVED